jgi:hypothetical protein
MKLIVVVIVCFTVAMHVANSFQLGKSFLRRRSISDSTQSLVKSLKDDKDASVLPPQKSVKYILVTGGVISGIGKGITASSLGLLLKMCGMRMTAVKIDP